MNQLTQTTTGGATYGTYNYDLDGNATSITRGGNNWALVWNAENRLSQVTTSQVTSYKYYDDGYLAERQQGTDVVKYINDGIHCIAKYSNGSLAEEYIYGSNIDEVLCKITSSGTWYYYHQDALQSVVAITDGSGTKAASYQYDVFGKVRSQTGTLSNEILFTGRWIDSTTSLYNYRARWYDANTGRFLSRDPIGILGGINFYGYVGNGPINYIDPMGEGFDKECLRAIAELILETAKEVLRRYQDLLFDKYNLYYLKRSGNMSWEGHQQQMENWQNRLNNLLEKVKNCKKKKNKCDKDDDDDDYGEYQYIFDLANNIANLPIPDKPDPKLLPFMQ